MLSLFRRKPAETAQAPAETAAEPEAASANTVTPVRRKGYTPSKKELGVVTPKRPSSARRPEPPPANRREALRRMREKQRQARAEARAGMLAGKEEYLLPRDKGPERALVRDIVDARRNVATYFLPGALIVLIGSAQGMPAEIRLAANLFWFMLMAAVILDSVLLCRRVRRLLTERFPKSTTPPRRHYWYAIMRSLSFRRMRIPLPKKQIGDKV